MRALRLVLVGWRLQVKHMSRSPFELMTALVLPVIYATIAFELVGHGGAAGGIAGASVGAGLMGIWSTTLFGAGNAIDQQRWQGTLELLVVSPAPFLVVLLSLALASTTIGAYALAATIVWGVVLYGAPVAAVHPLAFAAAIPATVVALGTLGVLMATTFVVLRNANAVNNMGEFPIWLLSGALVPLALLPWWTAPVSAVLAPTWGVRALRGAVEGGHPWRAIGACALLSAVQLALAALAATRLERRARARATLSLS